MSLNLKELSHDKLIELIESLIFEVNQLKEENKVSTSDFFSSLVL